MLLIELKKLKNNLCFFIKTNIKLYVWYFKINISSSTRLVMFRNWNDTSATQRLTTQVLNLLLHSQLKRWMENTYKDSFVRMLLLFISWLYSFLNRLTTMYIFFRLVKIDAIEGSHILISTIICSFLFHSHSSCYTYIFSTNITNIYFFISRFSSMAVKNHCLSCAKCKSMVFTIYPLN